MKFRFGWRLLRSAVVLCILLLAARSSDAATVTGTLKYLDTTAPECIGKPDCIPLRPIAYTQVEIWHHGTMFWDIWVPVGQVTTQSDGRFYFSDTRGSGTYAVRVFAVNYAAKVGPGGSGWFYAEPGHPGPGLNRTVSWSGQVVDFSFDFVDGLPPLFFNIAETVRRGFDYAAARRDPRETDPLTRANFVLTDNTMNPNNVSWYNPMLHEVVLHSRNALSDSTILHEYAHWLEAQLSSFAWIASSHEGCVATDAFGNISNSPEHAWMEGFADYFARAVPLFLEPGTLNAGSTVLETQRACGNVSPADAIENYIAVTLWDLADTSELPYQLPEFVNGMDWAIFQIFDRELDTFGHYPTIWDFRNAWAARHYDVSGLDRILSNHGILSLPAQTAQFVSVSAPAQMVVGTTATVSVRMRNTGVTVWTPAALHRLGAQNPHDNTTWGTNRVALPAAVAPGEYVTFTFTARAPSTPGSYNFQWRMVQDAVEWFGDLTPARTISVVSSTSPDPDWDRELCFDPEIRKYVPCG